MASKEKTKEEIKKKRQDYYQHHREEILKRMKEKRNAEKLKPKKTKEQERFEKLLNSWNEQLSRKLQENLPQWLEIALRDQITIINETLTNQE